MVSAGDAFLLPLPEGHSFGVVLRVDQEMAIVRSQAGHYGRASVSAIEQWKGELGLMATEVATS